MRGNAGIRTICVLVLLVLLLVGCSDQPKHTFTNEFLLPMTPVKNQGKSELCWAYAMLATIETEHLVRGDSVNLSPQYLGRMLKRKNQRAMCQTALNLLQRYGVVGFDVMPDDATDDLPTPKNVFLLGARYTPLEFAHSVCAPDEYIALTSFPDSPYYKKIDVPIPDNWEHNRLLNVPLDTLRRHVDEALKHRHPVCFESRGHAMSIVGMAHDENGHAYYVLKNSWGTNRPHDGLVYMSVRRLWRDVVALYMTRDAYEGKHF
jgi:bleomycin hydrolase